MMMHGMMGGMYGVWALLWLAVFLSFAYIVWILADKEKGSIKTTGQVLAIIVIVLAVIMFIWGLGYSMSGRGRHMMGYGTMMNNQGMMMYQEEVTGNMKPMMNRGMMRKK